MVCRNGPMRCATTRSVSGTDSSDVIGMGNLSSVIFRNMFEAISQRRLLSLTGTGSSRTHARPTEATSQRADSSPDWWLVSGSSLSCSTPPSVTLVVLHRTNTFPFLRKPVRLLCRRSKRHLLNPELPTTRLIAFHPFPKIPSLSLFSLLFLPSLLTFRGSNMLHLNILLGRVDQFVSELSAVMACSLERCSTLAFPFSPACGDCTEPRLSCHLLVSISESLNNKLIAHCLCVEVEEVVSVLTPSMTDFFAIFRNNCLSLLLK